MSDTWKVALAIGGGVLGVLLIILVLNMVNGML